MPKHYVCHLIFNVYLSVCEIGNNFSPNKRSTKKNPLYWTPLHTSVVKRGDWILRRVLGTPVPPPPADVGSIRTDGASAEGKSIENHGYRSLRRRFLRGMGVCLALSWLDSLPARSVESGKSGVDLDALRHPPTRFACIYFSNGVEPAHGWAKPAGDSMLVGPGLEPMRPFLKDMVFLKGLYNQKAVDHPSPHLGRIPNLLSGAWVSNDQNVNRVGEPKEERRACNLYLSLMSLMGHSLHPIGDADRPLKWL